MKRNKFVAVMMLCFIFGGYFLLSYVSQVQMVYTRAQFDNFTNGMNVSEMTDISDRMSRPRQFGIDRLWAADRLIYLLGGIMFLISGIAIWYLIREEEVNTIKEEMTDALLMPDEKEILDELKKVGGEITQSELVRRTGLSKVRVHRILKRLEGKKVIKSYPYGLTKKIIIKVNAN